jgi:hypothetical protein
MRIQDVLKWALPVLLAALTASGCDMGESDRVRGEALTSTRAALELARKNPGLVSKEGEAQSIWADTLLALDQASDELSNCDGRRSDDCLAAGLSLLLDVDRQLQLLEQMSSVEAESTFEELQRYARQAAGLLYVHFYGEGAGEGEDWRGPPTPRPPGVCPG